LEQGAGLALCPQVIHESYSILTKHYEVEPSVVADWLGQAMGLEGIEFLEPGRAESRLAIELAARKKLKGPGFYDACLAALVLNFDLGGICTDNVRDFKRLGIHIEPMREQAA
jgi:hypothetical protein